jgi:hypothetical protein
MAAGSEEGTAAMRWGKGTPGREVAGEDGRQRVVAGREVGSGGRSSISSVSYWVSGRKGKKKR